MQSKATTAAAYLKELPADREPAIEAVRKAILGALPEGYEEGMQYGMICWSVPHSIYPPGYHCDPKQRLPFLALASQKQYMSVYLPGVYQGGTHEGGNSHMKWFVEAWKKTGKKLDMGKCCLRFKKLEDLALDLIAELIRRQPVQQHVEAYERALAEAGIKHKGKKADGATWAAGVASRAGKTGAKKAAKKVTRKVMRKVATKSAR